MRRYEYIDHTADLAIRAWGHDWPQLLVHAAEGVLDAVADTSTVEATHAYPIEATGEEREDLLVALLSELIYQHEVQEAFFQRIELHACSDTELRGTAYGEPINPEKHTFFTEIKNVTYHQLYVCEREGLWEAQVILDL